MGNNIYIIGSGAIGKALAAFLKLSNKNVLIIRGSIDDGSNLTEEIRVVQNQEAVTAEVEVSTLSNFRELDGLIVLATKSFGNESISSAIKDKVGRSPIVILQNGLGVEQSFIKSGFPEIYRCVLFATSQVISDGRLNFKPVSFSPIGIVSGNEITLNWIVEELSTKNFPFKAELNIDKVIWKKVVVNCVFNSICPLLNVDNGVFCRESKALTIAKRIIKECVSISKEVGVLLEFNDVLESLLLISKSSEGNLISTLQDINNQRMTEIKTLNLEIARIAAKLGKGDHIRETKLLGELVNLKSELSMIKRPNADGLG